MKGKVNFGGYLISRFYHTPETGKNFMHVKNTFFCNKWLCDKLQLVNFTVFCD